MTGETPHFPDVDEYVWLIETGDASSPWSRWSPAPGEQARGGRAPWEHDAAIVARRVLDEWLAATVAAARVDTEDLWLRASVWRLGRVIDGGLVRTGPGEVRDLETYCRWLYAEGVDPDAVEVRTPVQVAHAGDELRHRQVAAAPPR